MKKRHKILKDTENEKRFFDITDAYEKHPKLIVKQDLRSFFALEAAVEHYNVQYYEGCQFLGYHAKGDSFVFTQGMGYDKEGKGYDGKKHERVLFCISRGYLEEILKDYPIPIIGKSNISG